ncbi:MAG: hypothetical protein LBV21_01200, partial [Candidatus Adiutrix sp.]|nr:hypothetical protein [Candidatus Adiutrix sp.]
AATPKPVCASMSATPSPPPPRCGLDSRTAYRRLVQGRQEIWACPNHPDEPRCPSYRVIPGDCL